ncbi:hypothetical protein ABID47_004754 [Paenibacillus favisporus]|uniref:Flagellar protein FliT n=1 Tax=Paenibacillus favisporus TaxID=221028 RepID=A0ABV2F8P3_9BACL
MVLVRVLIDELELLTSGIVDRLDDVSYEELSRFSDRRAELVNQMVGAGLVLNEEDKQRLHSLSAHDGAILNKMRLYKKEASEWLFRQGNIKEQRSAYHAGFTPESFFFDKRK